MENTFFSTNSVMDKSTKFSTPDELHKVNKYMENL